MKAHFKYPRSVDGKHYEKGNHELPDSHAGHWFFKGLVEAKDVTILDAPKADEPDEEKEDEKKTAPQSQKKAR